MGNPIVTLIGSEAQPGGTTYHYDNFWYGMEETLCREWAEKLGLAEPEQEELVLELSNEYLKDSYCIRFIDHKGCVPCRPDLAVRADVFTPDALKYEIDDLFYEGIQEMCEALDIDPAEFNFKVVTEGNTKE